MLKKKIFILDTSVLLYDKNSIHSFPDSEVIIPLVVLDEVDRFKEKVGIVGEAARYVNRYLDDLRKNGNIHEGIEIESGQLIKVEINHNDYVPEGLSPNSVDNRIIGLAVGVSKERDQQLVTVITKDINFRVKCDALGIKSEDYYKDRIVFSRSQIYSGQRTIELTKSQIDKFFSDKVIHIDDEELLSGLSINEFIIGKSKDNFSMMGKFDGEKIIPLSSNLNDLISVSPRNKEQKFALDLLTDPKVPLVTLTGIAGSGKTYLTLMSALSSLKSGNHERIVITRSIQPVGKDIGFLPGDINDKMDPWLSPIADNFRVAFKDITYYNVMRDKREIEVAPLSFIRGRTFNNTFIIVDESQNSTIHELKTIITRVGENSKIVLLGDIEQIDTPYIDSLSNGLTVVVEKFKNSTIAGHVTLLKGERSKIATEASRLI
jgi:PhoH-like ATPase